MDLWSAAPIDVVLAHCFCCRFRFSSSATPAAGLPACLSVRPPARLHLFGVREAERHAWCAGDTSCGHRTDLHRPQQLTAIRRAVMPTTLAEATAATEKASTVAGADVEVSAAEPNFGFLPNPQKQTVNSKLSQRVRKKNTSEKRQE